MSDEPNTFNADMFQYQAKLAREYCSLYTSAHNDRTLLLEMQGVISTAIDSINDNGSMLDCLAILQMQLATLTTMKCVALTEIIEIKLQKEYERKHG